LTGLNTAVIGVTKELIRKKPDFEAIADEVLIAVVYDQLLTFHAESKKLVDVIVGRLPSCLPSTIAQPFSQPIVDKLEEALKVYTAKRTK
jgi:hypothetical protein